MKKHYKRIKQEKYYCGWRNEWRDRWANQYINAYYMPNRGYYRNIKTLNEIRQNEHALEDGYKVRGKRRKPLLPTCWDDPRRARNYGKSWKDFTKFKKQYMVNL